MSSLSTRTRPQQLADMEDEAAGHVSATQHADADVYTFARKCERRGPLVGCSFQRLETGIRYEWCALYPYGLESHSTASVRPSARILSICFSKTFFFQHIKLKLYSGKFRAFSLRRFKCFQLLINPVILYY